MNAPRATAAPCPSCLADGFECPACARRLPGLAGLGLSPVDLDALAAAETDRDTDPASYFTPCVMNLPRPADSSEGA